VGVRHYRLLPGEFDSQESRAAFAQLQLELTCSPAAVAKPPSGCTVNEVLLAYLDHAERHYRGADGQPTDEVRHVKAACRYVRELYGDNAAADFGPLALKAVRQKFVEKKWCRKTINARVERVRRVFKWAVAEELVPPAVYQALAAVAGLQRGRTSAPDAEPVAPVDDAVVDATLPHLNRHVRGLVEFQRLTGCRPGEACWVQPGDLDTSGSVWLYKPAYHKTAWKGKLRTVAIGPKGQELLKEFFTPNIEDFLFSPRRAVEEQIAARTANRKTPRYPSHMKRNETKCVGGKQH
jgi:integrase